MHLSLVVPCFNQEKGLRRLYHTLSSVLPRIAEDFEVLLVDDGSTDRSLEELRRISTMNPRFQYLALSRNFGKEAAMLAGLGRARGDIVAIMDADLQHPPSLLAKMVRLVQEGHDQVVARRTRAGDPRMRTGASRMYYWLINKLSDVRIPNGAGDFRALSRRAVNALLALNENNRFSKGLFSWIGFDPVYVGYRNVARQHGASRWSWSTLLNYAIDGVVSFNNRPLRAAIYLGIIVTGMAFVYAAYVVVKAIVKGVDVPGYATLMVGIAGMGGLQLLFLGVLGEYLGRTYYEAKRRPHFIVKESSDDLPPFASVPALGRVPPTRDRGIRAHMAPGSVGGKPEHGSGTRASRRLASDHLDHESHRPRFARQDLGASSSDKLRNGSGNGARHALRTGYHTN